MKPNVHTAILCLTHRCNLNCVYCFEKKDVSHELSFEVASKCVDEIVKKHCYEQNNGVNLNFFGGEPLIRFELIRDIYNYIQFKYPNCNITFFISTNGTLLTVEMKEWFADRRDKICLGLSLDGDKDSHNHNRSNSFESIDIEYFVKNWPKQNFKLTLSEYSIKNFAHDVKFIHSYGVGINGGDVCVGNYSWDDESLYYIFAKQLLELINYYEKNSEHKNNLFELDLAACTAPHNDRKCCGCGTSLSYYETDGRKYPCTFIAPMGFSKDDLKEMISVDYNNERLFTDVSCKNECYIYNICRTCAAENFILHRRFDIYNKKNCGMKKILALAVAELQSRLIVKNPKTYDSCRLYHTIEAIKKIKELYLPDYGKYFIQNNVNHE